MAPKLAELHRRAVEMAEQESAWALAQLDSLSDSEREIVRQMADRLVRRVLYPVSRSLRAGVESHESPVASAVLRLGCCFTPDSESRLRTRIENISALRIGASRATCRILARIGGSRPEMIANHLRQCVEKPGTVVQGRRSTVMGDPACVPPLHTPDPALITSRCDRW